MILEKLDLKDGLRLEIVNKADISLSYKNNTLVSSCMSIYGRWKYTRLYNYVKDLKLLRIMKDDVLVLRSLLWSASDGTEDVKFIDRPYYKNYPTYACGCCCGNSCKNCTQTESHPSAYSQFLEWWPKFADVRNTNRQLYVDVLPNKVKIWPQLDTFFYYNPSKKLLSNNYTDGFFEYVEIDGIIDVLEHTEND